MATAALVLGIVGVIVSAVPIFGWILVPIPIVGLLLAILTLRSTGSPSRGKAIAAVALSGSGLFLDLAWAVLVIIANATHHP
jgi:hypothetical protein